jgi:hypothetical protein
VRSARRKRERAARSDPDQPPPGIENVEQRKEIILVGGPAVQKDERTLGLATRRPDSVREEIGGRDLVMLTA